MLYIARMRACLAGMVALTACCQQVLVGAEIDAVELGGLRQYVLVRQQQPSTPVMLFLHGGPGMPAIPFFQDVDATGTLEQMFTMVYWDQRGAGYSYDPDIPPASMTIEQFVRDIVELTGLLRRRFGVDKIYLMGHSWGTIIGAYAAAQHPELFHAYIGVAQVVDMHQNELLSYRFALEAAKRANNRRALRDLEEIGKPPYSSFRQMVVERRWARRFSSRTAADSGDAPALNLTSATEALPTWLPGPYFSMQHLWDELLQVNLNNDLPAFAIPVVFLEGRHDYYAPSSLAKQYFDKLQAPGKALVWFEDSAHAPFRDEPDKFAAVVVDLARRLGHLPSGVKSRTPYLAKLDLVAGEPIVTP